MRQPRICLHRPSQVTARGVLGMKREILAWVMVVAKGELEEGQGKTMEGQSGVGWGNHALRAIRLSYFGR